MLKKTRSADKVKVTFVLPSQPEAGHVHVVGDFNAWQASTPMKRDKEGHWRATMELEPGRDYQFRYLVNGNHWVNDEAADRYVPNPFGADNSVLSTPDSAAGQSGSSSRTAPSNGGTALKASAGSKKTGSATGKGASTGEKKSGSSRSRGSTSGPTSRGKGE